MRVTNGLNLLSDHGGYWDNDEEYEPRIAQIIESPHGRHASRFWDPLRTAWAERRRDRVTTLVAWRVFALITFSGAILWRVASGAVLADGSAFLDLSEKTPLVGGLVEGFRDTVTALGAPQFIQDLAGNVVGVLIWSAASVALYLAVIRVVYEPWSEHERRRAIAPEIGASTQRRQIILRTIPVVVVLGVLAIAAARFLSSEVSLGAMAVTAVAFILWWGFWLMAVPRIRSNASQMRAQLATQAAP